MQQRRPRLGDVLDDYCPRERRITNHVVVAMIEDQVKQTRCSTCDADHGYKQARTPAPRKTKAVAAIEDGAESFEAKPVLAAPPRPMADAAPDDEPALVADTDVDEPVTADAPAVAGAPLEAPVPLEADAESDPAADEGLDERTGEDEWFVHRPLMRAKLPRPEGHVPERKEPEFTVRQQGGRGGGGGREVDGNSVGYRPKGGGGGQRQPGQFGYGGGGGQSRFGGQRQGSGGPQRHSGRPAPPNGQRSGRPEGSGGQGNTRGQRPGGPGSGRRRGGR